MHTQSIDHNTKSTSTTVAASGASAASAMIQCDRDLQQDLASVDVKAVLRSLAGVPIQTWSYKDAPGVRHIGPMAKDFASAFRVGENDKQIHPVDVSGVALAAIQALYWMVQERDRQISELWLEIDGLREIMRQHEFGASPSAI